MSTNLFDDKEQRSVWPSSADVAVGWRVVYGEATRGRCLEYVEQNSPDIQPMRLRDRHQDRTLDA